MNFEKLRKYLDGLNEQFQVRCADCIVKKDHQIVFRHMNGTADLAGTQPLTKDHLHNIYSATKVMTVIAVMQLVEQRKLDLDAELAAYLPAFAHPQVLQDFDLTDFVANYKFVFGWPDGKRKPAEHKILLRDMLSMKAGFSYQLAPPATLALLQADPHAGTRAIVDTWAHSPLLYEPGTRYAYSYALDIMAAVVEAVSGMRFADYMKKKVFDPAGARDMFYHIPTEELERVSELYSLDAETQRPIPTRENPARLTDHFDAGGAGLACTVDAYSLVLDALANGGVAANGARILSPESIAQMQINRLNEQQLADFHIGGKHEYGYGYGVRTLIDPTRSNSPVGEFGWDGAAGAYALVDPKNHLSIFYVQEAPDSGSAFSSIHPTIRDLVYEELEAE